MKSFTGSIVLFILVFISNPDVFAQGIEVRFDHASFYSSGVGAYIETYLSFSGSTFHYIKTQDSTLEASAEVTMLIKNVNEIKEYRKFKVVSPPLSDTATIFPDFIDLRRIVIPQGVYNFDLIVKDNYAADSVLPFKLKELISVNFPENELTMADIELVDSYKPAVKNNIYVKYDYEYIPYVASVIPEKVQYLRFYTEVYNAAKEFGPLEDFNLLFHIENYNTSKPIKEYSSLQNQKAQNLNKIFQEINITYLPTGNYYLVIELQNADNELLLTSKKFFQRINKVIKPKVIHVDHVQIAQTFASDYTNIDSLAWYLKALKPIADSSEILFLDNQLETQSLRLMQQFLYYFWELRDATNPENGWNAYRQNIKFVEQHFSNGVNPGYTTARGRVYLQYGPPNAITDGRNESDAYPYEIWQYFKIANQLDKKFIFYNKSLKPNDYILLHSDFKGELKNADWEHELYSRSTEVDENGDRPKSSKVGKYFEGE